MKKLLKISLVASLVLSATALLAEEEVEERQRIKSVKAAVGTFAQSDEKEISVVDNFKRMFIDGKASGQIRSVYAGYKQKEINAIDRYATALGGMLKYELAEYKGFNAGVAFTTSQDIGAATGNRDKGKNNDELSSSTGHYTELTEAYINYNYKDLNLRAGRQILDTPLADSDDIRMIQNTFEAYVATYNYSGIEIMAGNIQKWQGVDAGLDDGWSKTGKHGTWFGGVSYSEDLEFNAWYYNVTNTTNAAYADVGYNYDINKDISIHGAIQYLNERELSKSGIEADIYGATAEVVVYGLGFNVAYNKSDKNRGKKSYSGTGGGTMFTSMDTMIIDEITEDRDATAVVGGMAYDIGNLKLLYAYGDFKGKANSAGEKAHIVEQNIGFEYEVNEEFYVAAIYVIEEDKENFVKTDSDWNRMQVMVAYNF